MIDPGCRHGWHGIDRPFGSLRTQLVSESGVGPFGAEAAMSKSTRATSRGPGARPAGGLLEPRIRTRPGPTGALLTDQPPAAVVSVPRKTPATLRIEAL